MLDTPGRDAGLLVLDTLALSAVLPVFNTPGFGAVLVTPGFGAVLDTPGLGAVLLGTLVLELGAVEDLVCDVGRTGTVLALVPGVALDRGVPAGLGLEFVNVGEGLFDLALKVEWVLEFFPATGLSLGFAPAVVLSTFGASSLTGGYTDPRFSYSSFTIVWNSSCHITYTQHS